MTTSHASTGSESKQASLFLSGLVLTLSLLAFVGWQFHIDGLTRLVGGWSAINPGMVLGVAMAALSLGALSLGAGRGMTGRVGVAAAWGTAGAGLLQVLGLIFGGIPHLELLPGSADASHGASARLVATGAFSLCALGLSLLIVAGVGGTRLRGMLPLTLCLPVVLGALQLVGEGYSLTPSEFGAAGMMLVDGALLTWGLAKFAGSPGRSEGVPPAASQPGPADPLAAAEERLSGVTRELEMVKRDLEAFNYSISHDLRAPLRHVNGFAELLQRHAGPSLDEEGRHYAQTIVKAAHQMGEMIDQLLALSRTGRVEMTMRVVPLGSLVAEAIEEQKKDERGRKVHWVVGPLPEIEGDPALLRQAVGHLLSNAVKYSSKQAEPEVCIEAGTEGPEVTVSIRDNGVGFDSGQAQNLFGVFRRLHSPQEFEGSGTGLAIVRCIVQRHGGRTWAEGQVNNGASFSFSLPRKRAA